MWCGLVRGISTSTLVVALGLSGSSLLGCSSSDTRDDNPTLEGFSRYCWGTLSVELKLMEPHGYGWIWSSETAPAGTPILLEARGTWEGYVIGSGKPMRVVTDYQVELSKGTHFSSDCADDDELLSGTQPNVLLADSTFFASEDLSGEACTLRAATELTNLTFVAGSVATVSANQIEAKCGLGVA